MPDPDALPVRRRSNKEGPNMIHGVIVYRDTGGRSVRETKDCQNMTDFIKAASEYGNVIFMSADTVRTKDIRQGRESA